MEDARDIIVKIYQSPTIGRGWFYSVKREGSLFHYHGYCYTRRGAKRKAHRITQKMLAPTNEKVWRV